MSGHGHGFGVGFPTTAIKGGGGGSPWTPEGHANLEMWLTPAGIDAQAVGGKLVAWYDETLNNHDWGVGQHPDLYPTVETDSLDGHSTITFDEVDDALITTSPAVFAGALDFWSVLRFDDLSASKYWHGDTSPLSRTYVATNGAVTWQTSVGGVSVGVAGAITTGWNLVRIARDASDNLICEVNGVDKTNGSPNRAGTYSIERLNYYANLTIAPDDVAEHLLFNAKLSAEDAASVLGYFQTKYPAVFA